jgi:serine protease inhibitor
MTAHWMPRIVSLGLLAIVVLIGCRTGVDTQPAPRPPPRPGPAKPPPEVDSRLVAANTRFGLNLFAQLRKETPDQNLFISPSSIAFALTMAYNGAAGGTRAAMTKGLELGALTVEEADRANAALREGLLNPDPEVRLSIANSLWAKKGVEFERSFIAANQKYFAAELATLDFANPRAADTINAWVSKNTQGKIREIVQNPIDGATMLFLINAVYFKGRWTDIFDEKDTKDEPFTLLAGGTKKVPLMSQSGEYRYAETDAFQAISLPYGKERVSMYVFLPAKASSLAKLCDSLTPEAWGDWISQMREREGTIKLPRFRTECDLTLNDSLKALGMADAFEPGKANFSAMCSKVQPLWISEVKHKTFVEVNEVGTEAAAVTSIAMAGAAAPEKQPPPPFVMVVDRPFLCAIRDNQTGTVLFLGAIVEPG